MFYWSNFSRLKKFFWCFIGCSTGGNKPNTFCLDAEGKGEKFASLQDVVKAENRNLPIESQLIEAPASELHILSCIVFLFIDL
jgi:hypothetical protein